MTRGAARTGFAARPSTPDDWVKEADRRTARREDTSAFTARLTIDVTPELRGRIKIEAFKRGVTVAEMLRALLAREFSDADGETQ